MVAVRLAWVTPRGVSSTLMPINGVDAIQFYYRNAHYSPFNYTAANVRAIFIGSLHDLQRGAKPS